MTQPAAVPATSVEVDVRRSETSTYTYTSTTRMRLVPSDAGHFRNPAIWAARCQDPARLGRSR